MTLQHQTRSQIMPVFHKGDHVFIVKGIHQGKCATVIVDNPIRLEVQVENGPQLMKDVSSLKMDDEANAADEVAIPPNKVVGRKVKIISGYHQNAEGHIRWATNSHYGC